MKRLLWLGICFLSANWLFSLPIFVLPQFLMSIFLIILGVFCIIFSFWKTDRLDIDKKYYLLLIPLLFPIILLNYPYNIGPIILFFGVILYFITSKISYYRVNSAVTSGLFLSAIILCIQTSLYHFYVIFVSHGHRIDILSDLVSFFGNIFGLKTSVNNGIVFVQTAQKMYLFTTTFEKLGFFIWLNIFIAAIIIFFLFYKRKNIVYPLILFLVISFFYLILRYVTFIFLYINTLKLDILWDPYLILLSFIPFVLILMKFIPLSNGRIDIDGFTRFKIQRKKVIAFCLFFIFIFCMVFSFTYHDSGKLKNGRILIDEYHSDWEDSIRPLDKEWYGLNSTYNYYSLANWLNYYYDVHQNIDQELSLGLLSQYDILILKCPTNSYSAEEIESIVDFVNLGGGLYLIGDHTDVFGMNTFLNQVSSMFGIRFNMDATYEIGTGEMTVYNPDKMYSHPIVHNLDSFEFMTSCTLSAPLNSENVIIGNRLIGEPGTYSTENFFRESVASPESEYGLLLQVVAVKSGLGRIVAFSDSTVFSSFSMFSDGYQIFTLGVLDYLNRANVFSYLNTVFFVIGIISLAVSIYILRNDNKIKNLFLFSIIGFLCFSISAPILSNINHNNYPVSIAHSDYVNVCFDQQYSNFSVSLKPSIGFFEEYDNFGTFYVWTQRVNCVPSLEKSLDDAIKKDDIIVFINPKINFEADVIDKLIRFVESGGSLLIMDSITNTDSTVNDLVNPFDMHIYKNTTLPNYNYIIENLSNGNNTSPYLSVSGGNKIVFNETNEIFINFVNVSDKNSGKTGKVVVFVDSFVFCNNVLGGTFTEPNDHQKMLYDIEFFIFEEILLKDR